MTGRCPYCGRAFVEGDVLAPSDRGARHRVCQDLQLELARGTSAPRAPGVDARENPDPASTGLPVVGAAGVDDPSETAA
jgi:hypothetical protein